MKIKSQSIDVNPKIEIQSCFFQFEKIKICCTIFKRKFRQYDVCPVYMLYQSSLRQIGSSRIVHSIKTKKKVLSV